MPEPPDTPKADAPAACPLPQVSRAQEFIDNLPYLAMLALGATIVWIALGSRAGGWLGGGLYAAYGLGGALWIILFVCPYCHFHGTRLCPCGYGQIAGKLRAKRDAERFRRQFRRHIPVIVPLWFIPLVLGGIPLVRDFSWLLCGLLLAFAVNSFVVLPLVSRHYGCAKCPQKATCPWMGACRAT